MPIGPLFNATGINTSEPLMKALECGYEVILTAMRADEIISTKSPVRRDALLLPFFAATILAARKLAALDLH